MNLSHEENVLHIEPTTPKHELAFSAELKEIIQQKNMLTCKTRSKVISALEDIDNSFTEKSFKELRTRAVNEIFTSELSYLKQLKTIKVFFMKPIKEKEILSQSDFQTVFGSIDTIYNVNKELFIELKKGTENVANAFLKIAPYLKLYSVYAYGYKNSLHTLQKSQESNSNLANFLELTESRPEVQNKLSALLITPIQRIPRYRLLLKQVVDYTLPSNSNYSNLLDSLNKIEQIANHINSTLEEQENTQRMLELQRSLQNKYPVIIRPGRQLIKEGILSKVSHNGTRNYKRYFVLMSDILMYCKMKRDDPKLPNSLKCCCILPLNKCKITVVPRNGIFRISCQNEVLVLFHEHASEGQEWVYALKDAIKKYIDNRQTLRKESSAKRPVRRKELGQFEDAGISPGHPRKKRNYDLDFTDVFRNTENDSDNSDEEKSFNPFKRLGKRKSKTENFEKDKKILKRNPKDDTKDSLYPLRRHLKESNKGLVPNSNSVEMMTERDVGKDIFVFGRTPPKTGRQTSFSFGINLFSSLANSFKKMFGYKES